MRQVRFFLANALGTLGVGLMPFAPGTWGSLLGVVLIMVFQPALWVFICLFMIVLLLAFWSYSVVVSGGSEHDPKSFVIDELLGMWLSALPIFFLDAQEHQFWAVVVSFFLFRFFDIKKPGPIGWLDQKMTNGVGVIGDDLLAGCFSAVSTFVIFLIFIHFTS